ncbi:MAG TPA: TonB family protein [Gammaproteobacteria bacterium]|nr:TonB family protein [Gammaproteobacteria bacterium]
MLKNRVLPLLCGLLAACASAPKLPPPSSAPSVVPQPSASLLIATPVNESGPASIAARVMAKEDSRLVLRFTVQPDGQVQDPSIVYGVPPDDAGAAVVKAFAAIQFKPYLGADGIAVSHEFIYPLFFGPDAVPTHTRYFCHHADQVYKANDRCEIVPQGAWKLYRITPAYPESLLSAPVAGSVTLTFDIDPAGGVPSNVKVVHSAPAGVFDTTAVLALQQWYFELADGQQPPAGVQHASATLRFRPPSGGY